MLIAMTMNYAPVFLQQIKLSKGLMWQQGSWVIMAQIDGRSKVMTNIQWWTLGVAMNQKTPRVSTFLRMMVRRPTGGAAHQHTTKQRRRLACF